MVRYFGVWTKSWRVLWVYQVFHNGWCLLMFYRDKHYGMNIWCNVHVWTKSYKILIEKACPARMNSLNCMREAATNQL